MTIGENDKNKMISCYAINQELGQTIQETHMISVLCKYLDIDTYIYRVSHMDGHKSKLVFKKFS